MSRTGSHQLSNGLYVSGKPEQHKERLPTMASRAVPYTGGDVKKSGDLGKMYGITTTGDQPHHQGPPPPIKLSSRHSSGSVRSGPNSGPLGPKPPGSGSIPKKSSSSSSFSGPMTPLQPTGLITSGPLNSSAGRRSSHLEPAPSTVSTKPHYGSAVTTLTEGLKLGFKAPRFVVWVFLGLMLMGLIVGAYLEASVKRPAILIAVVGLFMLVILVITWYSMYKKLGLLRFLRRYPNADIRKAVDGDFVKVTGVVTCGSIPLESSFQRVTRYSERYVADFYISDFQTGLRALVKAGYGAKVAPLVEPTTVVDVKKENKELSPNFVQWLSDRSLSSDDDRIMRLKEGYIKEGSTVTVMGVVRRTDNVFMIVPPADPVSTGCQWTCCLLPTNVEGLVLLGDENQTDEVIPV